MRGSDFVFDSVQLMHFQCHNVIFKPGGSYIDSLAMLKKSNNKPANWRNQCLQYAATVALIY